MTTKAACNTAAYAAVRGVKFRMQTCGSSPRCFHLDLEQVTDRDSDPFFILEEIAGAHTADLLRALLKSRGWE